MKIGIDLRSLSDGRHSGVEEYVFNIVSNLLEVDNNNTYCLFRSGLKIDSQNLSFKTVKLGSENSQSKLTGSSISKRNLKMSNRMLNISLKILREPLLDIVSGKPDVFFMPNINIAPVSGRCKKIITFHDLTYEIYPKHYSLKRRLWHKFINPRKQAEEARKIIAVSESTKNDLVDLYGIKPEKIEVIYSGLSKQFYPILWNDVRFSRIKQKYNLPDYFILYLGTVEPRKNTIGLIKAFEQIKNSGFRDLKLVIAGSRGWLYEEIIKTARESKNSQDIIFTGFVDNEDKIFVYNLAHLFVYPSFYEGFGFPPLEAMACGVPTITSNVSSLPEIVEEGAVMIDPYSIDELAHVIELCLLDQDLRVSLREKGLRQARKFSWENSAKKTLDLLAGE